MRVALVGSDLDAELAASLAGLGPEVVAFTRDCDDGPPGHAEVSLVKESCFFELTSDHTADALAFREAVLNRQPKSAASSRSFDVVHALDPVARPAAQALAARASTTACVASVNAEDLKTAPALLAHFPARRWIVDHPWTAERWLHRNPSFAALTSLVPTRETVGPPSPSHRSTAGGTETLVVFWLPRGIEIDTGTVAESLVSLVDEIPNLSAVVLGSALSAHALRRRLRLAQLIPSGRETTPSSVDAWNAFVSSGTVLATASSSLSNCPAAWAAWSFGVPVIGIDRSSSSRFVGSLRHAIFAAALASRETGAGGALVRRRLEPTAVAEGWLQAYLDARLAPPIEPSTKTGTPVSPQTRTGLHVQAIGSRELYASWQIRGADWETALHWLGHEAPRATHTLRLADITDIEFDGRNAHASWDVDVAPAETFRYVQVDAPGRSLVVTLGVRSTCGYLHPLAHAGPVHLPREAESPRQPTRRLFALPRR
jgi:hypothetical protein